MNNLTIDNIARATEALVVKAVEAKAGPQALAFAQAASQVAGLIYTFPPKEEQDVGG